MYQVGFLGVAAILILGCAQAADPDPTSPLASYWDEGEGAGNGCGPRGDNFNMVWCKWGPDDCSARVDGIDRDVCRSGKADFESVQGDATDFSQVVVDGCNYKFIAQYKCVPAASCSIFSGCPTETPVHKGSSAKCFGDDVASCAWLTNACCEAANCGSFSGCSDARPVNKGSSAYCSAGTATCDISTCCEAQATCDLFSDCANPSAVNKGSGVKCSGNEASCDTISCCDATATCADFSGCSAPLAANRGSSVLCSGNAASCDKTSCCEAQGTCDSFSNCPSSAPNKGNTVTCTGNSASCDASTCCEAPTSTPAPTPSPTPAVTPAPTTPVAGSTIVSGSLQFTVSDPNVFAENKEVVNALIGALAEVFGVDADAVSILEVALGVLGVTLDGGGRRLRQLAAGGAKVDYQITGNVQEGIIIMDAGPLIKSALQQKLEDAGISITISAVLVSEPIITTVPSDGSTEPKNEEDSSMSLIIVISMGVVVALACLSVPVVYGCCKSRASPQEELDKTQLRLEEGQEEDEEEDEEGEEEEGEEDGGLDKTGNKKKKKKSCRRKKKTENSTDSKGSENYSTKSKKERRTRKTKGDDSNSLGDTQLPAVFTTEEIKTQNAILQAELAVLQARKVQFSPEGSQGSLEPAVKSDSMKTHNQNVSQNPIESTGLTEASSLDVSAGLLETSSAEASRLSKRPEEEPQEPQKAQEKPASAVVGKGAGWTEAFLRRQGTDWMAQKLIELTGRRNSTGNAEEPAGERKPKKSKPPKNTLMPAELNLAVPPIGKSRLSNNSADTSSRSPRPPSRETSADTLSRSTRGPQESRKTRKAPARKTSDIDDAPVDKPRPTRKKSQSAMS